MRPSGRNAIRHGSSKVAVVVILKGRVASGFCSPTLVWAQAAAVRVRSSAALVSFTVTLLNSRSKDVVYKPLIERQLESLRDAGTEAVDSDTSATYFGIGIETALTARRSAIQIVSPAGSTAVGVLRPSLIPVTLAFSPSTVMTEILPLAFSATISLPFAARIPSGPFTGWSIQISTGCPALPASI